MTSAHDRSAGFFWISWQDKTALFQYTIKSDYVFGKKERGMDSMSFCGLEKLFFPTFGDKMHVKVLYRFIRTETK